MSDAAIPWITFDTELSPAPAPERVVYATAPRVGVATDQRRYFLKGPRFETVVAEALGYMLATEVGLAVPAWALCHAPGTRDVLFASRGAAISSGIRLLMQAGRTVNPGLLSTCLAFDVWTANTDRNMGSLVAEPAGDPTRPGFVELLAIDFEQAQVLRGTDFMAVGALPDDRLWPRGEIAELCRGAAYPAEACERIGRVSRPAIDGIFERLAWGLTQTVPWADRAAMQLEQRAAKIDTLVRRVWRG